MSKKPVVVMMLDGYGLNKTPEGHAVTAIIFVMARSSIN